MKTIVVEDRESIDKIIRECKTCFLGMADSVGNPYVLPMNFGYQDNEIILHSSQTGRAVDLLMQNFRVCVTFCTDGPIVWQNEKAACSYRVHSSSVIAEGNLSFITDFDEKSRYLQILMQQYSSRSFKFATPAVVNVNLMVVKIQKLSAKVFGVSTKDDRNNCKETN